MSYKIFDLKDASIEEERFIKKQLRMHRIKFYETPKGRHSNPAIWVKTALQEVKAKKVIGKCQKKWRENVKQEQTPGSAILNKKSGLIILLFAIVLILALLRPMS
ncbi:MAG: DUF6164 family protein [Gammaproteobacteria bacterium]|nr:DUF6164 family protein [Gammaproteobacteria bacterium]